MSYLSLFFFFFLSSFNFLLPWHPLAVSSAAQFCTLWKQYFLFLASDLNPWLDNPGLQKELTGGGAGNDWIKMPKMAQIYKDGQGGWHGRPHLLLFNSWSWFPSSVKLRQAGGFGYVDGLNACIGNLTWHFMLTVNQHKPAPWSEEAVPVFSLLLPKTCSQDLLVWIVMGRAGKSRAAEGWRQVDSWSRWS